MPQAAAHGPFYCCVWHLAWLAGCVQGPEAGSRPLGRQSPPGCAGGLVEPREGMHGSRRPAVPLGVGHGACGVSDRTGLQLSFYGCPRGSRTELTGLCLLLPARLSQWRLGIHLPLIVSGAGPRWRPMAAGWWECNRCTGGQGLQGRRPKSAWGQTFSSTHSFQQVCPWLPATLGTFPDLWGGPQCTE